MLLNILPCKETAPPITKKYLAQNVKNVKVKKVPGNSYIPDLDQWFPKVFHRAAKYSPQICRTNIKLPTFVLTEALKK